MEPTAHSKIGGSVAARIINCPWSLANIDRAPVQPSSPEADEGSALHEIMYLHYTGEIEMKDAVGLTFFNVTITEEHLERLEDAGRALDAYCDQLEEETSAVCDVYYEQRVAFDRPKGAFGTADIIVRCGNVLAIVDYKFGQNPVNPTDNAQLMFYAAAALDSHPEITRGAEMFELVIIQPALENNVLQQAGCTLDDLLGFRTRLIVAVEESKGPEPRCQTGSHCKWCPLEAICPEKQELALRAVRSSADKTDMASLVYWMDHGKELESFLSAVRATVLEYLENGVEVEGYKLVDRRANRTWVDDAKIVAYCELNGFSSEEYAELKLLSPAQMEKKLKLKIPDDLIQKVSSGHTVAPMSDKRPDLNANDLSALKRLKDR